MKLRKLISLVLVGAMTLTLGACGNSQTTDTTGDGTAQSAAEGTTQATETKDGDKLVIWTLSNDLKDFADRYTQETGVATDVVVIEPANYPTKIQTALVGGEKEPDVIVAEPQMLQDFYDNGFFADLDQFGAKDYEGKIVDYVWKMGQDESGVQRAVSYQITPAGIYYRRDIAKEVFGTDDPDEIGKLFKDYSTIMNTAQKLKDAGYRIFASDSEINYFSGDSAWVIDGVLNVDQARYDYMDLVIDLYQKDMTAYANQ